MRLTLFVAVLSIVMVSNPKLFALQNGAPGEPKKAVAKYQYKSQGIEVPAATADEPKIATFGPESILAAKKYLDDGANFWVRERSCIACHSTGVYMVERPPLTPLLGKPSTEVLDEFVESVTDKIGPPEIRDGVKYWGVRLISRRALASSLPTSLNITYQFPWVFRTPTPPEGQYSYSIGWTIEYEYEYEYHFIEYEYESVPKCG